MSGSYLKFSSLVADAIEELPLLDDSENTGQIDLGWR